MTTTGVLLIVLAMMTSSMAYDELTSSRTMTTTTSPNDTTDSDGVCKDGLVLPRWSDDKFLSLGDRISRGLVYFLALCYLFVGVSIVADRFMAAIEVITSQEKEITIKRSNGETQTVVVRIWNETVANLTLMALGSSAPEILLSIIEICGMGFNSGDLGPGTIVGSAAFNLFIIIALCVYVVPSSEVRRVKHLRVFFITATWSVFAYIWLYIILVVTSYGVIELWEALLTLVFFPLTVLTAYIADRRLLIYKYLSKKYRMNARGVIVEGEGGGTSDDDDDQVDVELTVANHVIAIDTGTELKTIAEDDGPFDEHSDEIREFEQHRRDYVIILRDLRKKHPDKDMDTLETMARDEIANRGPKSRAFYRIQATRKLTGGGNVIKRSKERRESGMSSRKQSLMDGDGSLAGHDDNVTRVFFDPGHYTVMENVGEFNVTVSREGGDLSTTIFVDYRTEDGTANAGSDYVYGEGTLVFFPGEIHKQFKLAVIDDDVFEEDEHFYVRLTSARAAATAAADARSSSSTSMAVHANGGHGVAFLQSVDIVEPSLATVMILDDDHGGIFNFVEKECEIAESIGQLTVKVNRFSGARGRVSLPYRTFDGTAKQGRDYEHVDGELVFENNETEKSILVNIIEEDSYEKDVTFFVELLEPKVKDGDIDSGAIVDEDVDTNDMTEEQRIALMGRPKLGDYTKIQVRIKESKEFKNTVDKLIKMANMSVMVGTSSWREQFIEAITVSAGDDDDDDEDGDKGGDEDMEKLPSCSDYVMHFITIFWKILFALIPPTDYFDGWLCFVVSILGIGLLTALIGDLASHFGCTVGLKDTVTAISFVALGTSVPDTFASKVAATNDKYADSSIGNVTGSNAVNVFLGLGIAWSMAAIYHATQGTQFKVPPGSLAFSVTLFCSMALFAISILLLRRSKKVGGELGGPMKYKIPTAVTLVCFWLFYILMSSFEAYGIIKGF